MYAVNKADSGGKFHFSDTGEFGLDLEAGSVLDCMTVMAIECCGRATFSRVIIYLLFTFLNFQCCHFVLCVF